MPYHCSSDSAERESMKVGMHKRAVDSYKRDTCLGANRIAYACSLTLFYRKSSSSSSFLFFRSLFLLFSLTIITIFSPLQRRMMKKIKFHFILFFTLFIVPLFSFIDIGWKAVNNFSQKYNYYKQSTRATSR